MRGNEAIAIISDIHANYPALKATLADIRKMGVADILCLGDLVGYNTFATEVIELLNEHEVRSVAGNHDLMAVGRLGTEHAGPKARAAISWTKGRLSSSDVGLLSSLPSELRVEPDGICLHAGYGDPELRLLDLNQFSEQHEILKRSDNDLNLCFTGHTHVPTVVTVRSDGRISATRGRSVALQDDAFHFINPGSVGYPRLSDYRASYCIIDRGAATVQFRRVQYDRRRVILRNSSNGLSVSPGPSVAGYKLAGITRKVKGAIASLWTGNE